MQRYYCLECSQEDGKHEHKPMAIAKQVDVQNKKWHDLKIEVVTAYEEGGKRYTALEPLIRYIEEAMMDPEATFERQVEWLSVQKTNLDTLYKEGT